MSVEKQWVKNIRKMLALCDSTQGLAAKTATCKCIYEYLCSSECDDMVNHDNFVNAVKNNACDLITQEGSMWEPAYKLALCRFRDDIEFFEKLFLLREWLDVIKRRNEPFDLDSWSKLNDFQERRDRLVTRKVDIMISRIKENVAASNLLGASSKKTKRSVTKIEKEIETDVAAITKIFKDIEEAKDTSVSKKISKPVESDDEEEVVVAKKPAKKPKRKNKATVPQSQPVIETKEQTQPVTETKESREQTEQIQPVTETKETQPVAETEQSDPVQVVIHKDEWEMVRVLIKED